MSVQKCEWYQRCIHGLLFLNIDPSKAPDMKDVWCFLCGQKPAGMRLFYVENGGKEFYEDRLPGLQKMYYRPCKFHIAGVWCGHREQRDTSDV